MSSTNDNLKYGNHCSIRWQTKRMSILEKNFSFGRVIEGLTFMYYSNTWHGVTEYGHHTIQKQLAWRYCCVEGSPCEQQLNCQCCLAIDLSRWFSYNQFFGLENLVQLQFSVLNCGNYTGCSPCNIFLFLYNIVKKYNPGLHSAASRSAQSRSSDHNLLWNGRVLGPCIDEEMSTKTSSGKAMT